MLTREQKEVPPIGESVKRIVGSISKLADTAVKSAVTLKKLREEMISKDRVIAKQQAEIEKLQKENADWKRTYDKLLLEANRNA